MTEKRFNVFDVDGTVFIEDHKEGSYHIGEKENVDIPCLNDIADRLNTYADENEDLKQFQTNVFTLINEMIETANLYRTPIKSLAYGDDLGYWNGVYQKLKELRDILENEKTRR